MVRLERASFSFGYEPILSGVDMVVPEGARAGLVGRNGAGKTTLFRLILGEAALDEGSVEVPKQARIAFLAQHPSLPPNETLLHHVLESHPTLWELEEQILRTEEQMARISEPSRLDRLVERHRSLARQFEDQGGYELEHRVTGILTGLGFNRSDLLREIGPFSPGEKNRIALAKVLLAGADILLLDEATNHLDFEMLEWLQGFLQSPARGHSGREVTVIAASHDRAFLNSFATHILELRDGRIATYRGNYDDYVEQKAQELESRAREYRLQQAEIVREEEFIRRNFAAQKARQAKSREKKLARMEVVDAPSASDEGPRIRFDSVTRPGNDVLRIRDLACGYDGVPILSGINLELRKGDRIALLGPNGSGKTTFLRTVISQLPPLSGYVRRGARTVVGYYEQDLSHQGGRRAIFEEVHDVVPQWSDQEVRDLLAAFLFRGDEIRVATETLSGGEKARVALIRLILSGANFLVLDEPTNHLDVFARAALEESLERFPGVILFVSHDRCFVDRLASRTLAVHAGGIRELPGGYAEYREILREERSAAEARREESRRRERRPARRRGQADSREAVEARLYRAIAGVEEELRRKQEEAGQEAHYRNPETMRRLKREMTELGAELDALYRKWEQLGG